MYTPIDELIEEFRRTWMDFGMAESAPMYDPGRRYKRQDAEDSTEALKAAIERLQAENVALHEQVAALESREVCTVAHDDVETCGYCQRDALRAALKKYGEHSEDCPITIKMTVYPHPTIPCLCGLGAALEESK